MIFLEAMTVGFFCLFMWELTKNLKKKAKVETVMQIQCSSGDSEVMTFTSNFNEAESQDSKDSKISEAFQYIQDRRDENHEKWLKIQADAKAENEEKMSAGEELKLKSVTQVEGKRK